MCCFALYSGVETVTGMWAASYCTLVRGLDAATAASWASLFYLGITVGRFLSGFLTMKFNDQQMIRMGQLLNAVGIVLILLPLGKKLCKSVDRSAAENGGSTWKNVLSGVFMLVMFSVYIPILLFTDNVQAAVMITGLVIAIGVGVLAKRPGLAWLNNFVMAFSMLGGLISSLAWVRIFG